MLQKKYANQILNNLFCPPSGLSYKGKPEELTGTKLPSRMNELWIGLCDSADIDDGTITGEPTHSSYSRVRVSGDSDAGNIFASFEYADNGKIKNFKEIKFNVARETWNYGENKIPLKCWFLSQSKYPFKTSSNGKYFTDENNEPIESHKDEEGNPVYYETAKYDEFTDEQKKQFVMRSDDAIIWGSIKDVLQNKKSFTHQSNVTETTLTENELITIKPDRDYIVLWSNEATDDNTPDKKKGTEYKVTSSKNYMNYNNSKCEILSPRPPIIEGVSDSGVYSLSYPNQKLIAKSYIFQINNEIYEYDKPINSGSLSLTISGKEIFTVTEKYNEGNKEYTLTFTVKDSSILDSGTNYFSIINADISDDAPFIIKHYITGDTIEGFVTNYEIKYDGEEAGTKEFTIYGVGIDVSKNTVPTFFEHQLIASIDCESE